MILEDVVKTLNDDADLPYTSSENLFYSRLPEDPDSAACVYEYVGDKAHTLGGGIAVWEVVRIQVMVRATTYSAARTAIEKVIRALDVVVDATINGTKYMRIMSIDTPTQLEPDAKDRVRLVTSFEVTKELSVL